MRIVELRHHDKDFIVFVNASMDISTLARDSRFRKHAVYADRERKSSGVEFKFVYHGTLKVAKAYVNSILKGEK